MVMTTLSHDMAVIYVHQYIQRVQSTGSLHPITRFDSSLPRWNGSPAADLLKEDLLAGRYVIGQPKLLYESRVDYQVFSMKVFRGHIHQEIKTQKYWKYYGTRFSKDKKI
jgi:hypothetical protein